MVTAKDSRQFREDQGGIQELLTVREAANWLRVTVNTVRHWVKEGRLRGVKIGKEYRISRRDLEAWYEAQRR